MGFDPVKLEQHYLALYSLYANYMGQGKETAQVAIKHVLSDLQEEASARYAIPLPSPVAPTVTVCTVEDDVATLKSLEKRLSGVARKSLLA